MHSIGSHETMAVPRKLFKDI